MVDIHVARPFTLNRHQQPPLRFNVGVYDVDPAIAAHPYVVAHLEAAVAAAGGVLVQHRPLPQPPQSAGVNVFASSLQIVGSIAPAAPGDPVIDYWPPNIRPGLPAPGVEPPPIQFPQSAQAYDYYFSATGKLFQLRPVDDAGTPLGDWQPIDASIGAPPGPPIQRDRIILRGPDIPPEDPQQAMLMRVQREGATSRMGVWHPVVA